MSRQELAPRVKDLIVRRLKLEIDPTVQAYNALSLTTLLRFCDDRGLRCTPNNVLLHPEYMSLSALPDNCRRLARERLEDYGRTCPAEKKDAVAGVVRHLQGPPPPHQPQLLSTLLAFTSELDASRSERLADAEPELSRLIAEAAAKGAASEGPGVWLIRRAAGAWRRRSAP